MLQNLPKPKSTWRISNPEPRVSDATISVPPKCLEIPDQIEHTEAFIDLLSDLGNRGGNKKDIAELQRELRAQMRKDDYGELEVSYRRSLSRRIQRVVDATMSALRADISEW